MRVNYSAEDLMSRQLKMRRCTKCDQYKFFSDYHRSPKSPDGCHSICKKCKRKIEHARYMNKKRASAAVVGGKFVFIPLSEL